MSQENRRVRRAFMGIKHGRDHWAKRQWYWDDSQRRFDERCEADARYLESINDAGLVRTISAAENDCMNGLNGFEDDPAQHSS